MTAKEAREIAFNKVGTSYEDSLKNIISHIDDKIEEKANQGELKANFCISDLVETITKTNSITLVNTVVQYLKTHYEELGFKAESYRHNVSPDVFLNVIW